MNLAIIGSRSIQALDLAPYITSDVTEIISGGASGIDALAEQFADEHRLSKHIIRPQYARFPSRVAQCDGLLAFWDGRSKGTLSTIHYAKKSGKPIAVYQMLDGQLVSYPL